MPFVVINGFPSSGKSKRCKDLQDFIRNHSKRDVNVISENQIVSDKNSTFSSSHIEKDIRGALKEKAVRLMSREDIVILDALNYIKGFRYELYCISKNSRTPQVTLQCVCSPGEAWDWNLKRPEHERYSREVFDALVLRAEEPDSRHRWDQPLITVRPEQATPCQQVLDALEQAPAPRPNLSIQNQAVAPTDVLFELDRCTQEVVKAIMAALPAALEGDLVPVPGATERYLVRGHVTLAQLSRARRQFVAYMKTRLPANPAHITTLFVQYLGNTDNR